MTPTCENCKFWAENSAPDSYDAKRYPNGLGECLNENFVYTGTEAMEAKIESRGAWLNYWDMESYSGAGFSTGPNFGCVHFEEGEL